MKDLKNLFKQFIIETRIDLHVDNKTLLHRTHNALTHLLHPDTRAPDYSRSGYTQKLYDNIGYLKALHHAIGNALGRPSLNSPDRSTPHPEGKKGGLVDWKKPRHQKALLWASRDLLNTINAQHGNPYNYGPKSKLASMDDKEFDRHLERLGEVVGTSPWPDPQMKNTLEKLLRRS